MKVNGKELAVEQHGDGEAVLMIHGLGGSSNTWFGQRRMLARYFNVVCPDLDGSSRSPLSGTLSIDGFVEDMVALLDALDIESAHVVGHSMGTIVCQHLAVSHSTRVRSMLLMGPLAEPPPPARKALTDRAALARKEGMVPIADAMVGVSISENTRANQPTVAAMVREILMRQSAEGYAKTCEALAGAKAAEVERVCCPTLLLTGDEDPVGPPANTQDLAKRIPDSSMLIFSRTGHWTPIERPFEVNKAMLNFYLGGSRDKWSKSS
ncbi:MAG: alpha/beta hydrolase [Haliea sp.]